MSMYIININQMEIKSVYIIKSLSLRLTTTYRGGRWESNITAQYITHSYIFSDNLNKLNTSEVGEQCTILG